MLSTALIARRGVAGSALPRAALSAAADADAQPADTTDHSLGQLAAAGASYRPVVSGNILQRHGRDLTLEAAEGRLDPLIGRQDVLERALQVLMRRTKNNPVLIGEPGVGKTAVAEGIAQLIVSPHAPRGLAGRSLIALDVGSLVSGTQYRGSFEERLTSLLREVRLAAGRVILFIDELHTLMDAGRVEGGVNAANLLKPALARGELHCVGATTVDEYRRHIEPDGAFARRFQPVAVEEPTPEEAAAWLRGLRGRYEAHHGVRFTDAALSTAVRAAQRYIPDRRLPDSAIDVIDEAAARARLRATSAAARAAAAAGGGSSEDSRRLAEWLRAGQHQAAAASAAGPAAAQGPAGSLPPLAGVPLALSTANALSCPHCGTPAVPRAGSETVRCGRCAFVYLSIPQEKLLLGASLFTRSPTGQPPPRTQGPARPQPQPQQQQAASSAAAAAPPPVTQPATAAAALGAAAPAAQAAAALPPTGTGPTPGPLVVDSADVLSVVAEASGIPAEHLSASAWQSLASLEQRLRERVAGQCAAVDAVVGAVRLGRLGLQRGGRPLASVLLTGPAGVGKATLAEALAECLFGSRRHLLRLNLAEFADKASVSRLVGAPPGYVGYGDGGLLTDALRRRPHSVVLLERCDRAHPEVLALVVAALEAGQLQDSMGRRCDLRNALLLLTTSPTAAPLPAEGAAVGAAPTAPAAQRAAAVDASGAGGTTTVANPEGHMHPEAHAGGSGSGSLHSAHSASAQCLDAEPGAGGPAAPAARFVHPLRRLPDELLARLDAVVGMQPLSPADMLRVVELRLDECRSALAEQGVQLAVDPDAQRWLADRGLSSTSGARHLQPLLREQLLLPVADALLGRHAAGLASEGPLVATASLADDGSRLDVQLQG